MKETPGLSSQVSSSTVLCWKIKDCFANLASKVKEKVYLVLSYFRFTEQNSFIGKMLGKLVVFVYFLKQQMKD